MGPSGRVLREASLRPIVSLEELQRFTGAVCGRSSSEEGRSGEEAERRLASPAVDVLGANPQAAQNVAGESPRHAPQPTAAAPRPVPPFTNPSAVPLPDCNNSAFPSMESIPPNTLPGTLPSSNIKTINSQEVLSEETTPGTKSSLPTSLPEELSSSAGTERLPTRPPVKSQIDSTVEEHQYGSQTIKEKSLTNSQEYQIRPPQQSSGPVVVTEFKPESGTNVELKGGNLLHPQSQICFTVASPGSQSSVGLKVQELPVHTIQSTHRTLSGVAESVGSRQDSKSQLQITQTDTSETKPKTVRETSHDAVETWNTNSLESVESFLCTERHPRSVETLPFSKAGQSAPGRETSVSFCGALEAAHVDRDTRDEHADTTTSLSSSGFNMLPEFSSSKESSSNPPAGSSLPDTSLVVSLQAGTSHTSDQVPSTETSLFAEILRSSEAQEIVVVRDGGDWSNMHLNQNYLLQREDGSVCQAAIVNQLSAGEPKLYEEGVQARVELHSQPVEVYEFCSLVEEVAEETICVGGSSQIPHSPGYEVNLFNALLENADEDLEPSIHTVAEADTIIISQEAMASPSDDAHNVAVQNPRVTTVGQHLVLNSNQTVEVAHMSEVCLVQVAAVTADSFTVEETDVTTQTGIHCSQTSSADLGLTQVSDSAAFQRVSTQQEAVLSPAVAAGDTEMSSAVSVHVSSAASLTPGFTFVSAIKPEFCVSSQEGNRVSLSLTETKPEAFCTTYSSTVINPKLLLFKPGETPLLKHPPSLQAKVSKQPSVDGKLAGAHSSLSGTASKECLPQPVLAAESPFASAALGSHKDQTQCSVHKTSTATTPVKVQQTASVIPTASTSKSEALTFTQTSTKEADPSPQNVATFPGVPQPITPQTFVMLSAAEERDETEIASINPNDSNSYPDYAEDESEDMDQYQDEQASDIHEVELGHVSSPEEDSDDEADPDRSEMTTPSSSHKVRQWIADRVTVNSSSSSPSTSTSFLGPSSTPDWKTPQREKTSPLRGPHGKFVSPSSVGYSSSSSPPDQSTPQRSRGDRHTDMAELAKHEADIENRTQSLKKEGFWSMKRLSRLPEPQRTKVHWDYLCEEMQWLSADFAQERRWKRGVARKVVRMVMRHHEELRQKEEKAKRDEHAKIRRVAASIAKEVRAFWSNVEKVVQFKQQSRLEEKRKKALDLQLDFIVGQTEKYSDLLSKSLARPADADISQQKSLPPPVDEDDQDFEPPCEEDDDEETIEVEEQQEGNDAESHQREIELLKEESMLPLDQLLSTLKLPPSQESGSEEECSNESSLSAEEDEDGEFTANEEDAEDEEDTIAAQEKVEGNVNHAEELNDLAKEGDMSLEELLEKYKGAYASDFEAPSASASKASSDSEVSGDEEVENEEDESDVESNTSSSDSPGDSADDDTEKDEEEDEECGDEGMELLLKEGDQSPPSSSSRPKKEISHIAATAESLQPKGYTLATTKVKIPIPFLLHGTLREYQHIGLDWLVTMYEKKLNGILADEMGLGKTIQTIALLAHLACEKGNWGPHLIIVPTSVMLNWEMELKRWCPGFKILTYFGSQKERKLKRQGWTKPNAFHVCITSYKLVLQDHQAFRRKSWRYLILDEAQNIKNFKSQRWQSLLNFNSHRRLLLTGTPLQNSLMELWSLMHFLMPHVFQSHREFKEWFSNPLTGMIEGSQEYNEGLVKRLHKVLRPFLLRRIKVDVEKQMPKKYEHVVRCRLSKRQRFLYDDFMAQASTRETLASGHFMSVINILMQLRKVCNHPNLFDPRPIQSPFITQPIVFHTASLVQKALEVSPLKRCDLSAFDLVGLERHVTRYQAEVFLPRHKVSRQLIQDITESPEPPPRPKPVRMKVNRMFQPPPKGDNRPVLLMNKPTCSVPPAAQTTKPPPVPEAVPASAPVVQQVVCSVASTAGPRPPIHPSPQTAVRSSAPKPILTVRPPTAPCAASIPAHSSPTPGNIMPQRVLLSPDMQARLPSGEVVSIAQLASLAGRPVSSSQGSKPVTFQLQGNKLTLSGAQIHQVPAAGPRPVQGNVMHLVSSGMQHHLISQPAQLTVQTTTSTHAANTPAASPTANKLTHNASPQVPSSMVSSPGVVKIVVRQASGKEGGPVPSLAVAPSPRLAPQAPTPSLHPHSNTPPVKNTAPLQIAPRTPGPGSGPATAHYTIAPLRHPSSNPNQLQPLRPVLKVVQPPPSSTEQPAPALVATLPSVAKPSAAPQDDNSSSNQPPATTKLKPSGSAKTNPPRRRAPRPPLRSPFHVSWLADEIKRQRDSRLDFVFRVNERRCGAMPVYGHEVLDFLTFLPGPHPSPAVPDAKGEWSRSGHSSCLYAQQQDKQDYWFQSPALREAIHNPGKRVELLSDVIDRFVFAIPPVEAPVISMHCCHPPPSLSHKQAVFSSTLSALVAPLTRSLHRIHCNMRTQFPDLRLIQYDCGKLQTLHTLLRKLKSGGHRVLIFTQMTRMLDVLEQFLNYHGHIYLRLDGSTRVEQRQALMERFNADRRIFCFILSTRSGGVGVNLTGADTVVFYDSDWNPTMDAQAQDRCHRIGQTRDVHIYRLISERTVEENILKKANQKRMLGDMAIEGGNFTTAFFKEQTIRELFDVNDGEKREVAVELSVPQAEEEEGVNKQSTTILEQALCRAEDEEDIVAASQAKAEQVAELAEFNENIPLDDGAEQEEVEELSKAEQEIAALVEQLTPIERYAMNFLEASLEDVCKEELKQAEEQVEAARKGLDQAKEEGLMLHPSSDEDDEDFLSTQASSEPSLAPARRGRKPKDRTLTSTRTSGRLRGASPEPEPQTPREVPERLRSGLRGRPPAKDSTPLKASTLTKLQDSKSFKASSPTRDQQTAKTRTQPSRSHPSPVPSPTTSSPTAGKQQCAGETDSKAVREEKERRISESSLDSSFGAEHLTKDDDGPMSPPSTSSRSPRKRQTADGEVLRGLVDDSPSAKVLRKLPGRLVTVVEEKEPRRRRRRGSEAGGSSEEVMAEEHTTGFPDELSKDNTSQSPDEKPKPTADRSPQDHDSGQSLAVHPQPVRGYPPYSPPHLSPDMPVLRNLPVRRRLETESRMAAQLGEQQQLQGRGRGASQTKKTDTESSINCLVTPLKRKRGRPPKTPTALPEPETRVAPSPSSPSEDGNPPLSPKRKRGRPRKDTTATSDVVCEVQNSNAPTPETRLPPETTAAAVLNTDTVSKSTRANEAPTEASNSAQPTAANTVETSMLDSPLIQAPAEPTEPLPASAATSASVQCHLPSTLVSPPEAESHTSVPSVSARLTLVTSTAGVSTAALEPNSLSVPINTEWTEPDSGKSSADDATSKASPPPAAAVQTLHPSFEPSITESVTTTDELHKAATAAPQDLLQDSAAPTERTVTLTPHGSEEVTETTLEVLPCASQTAQASQSNCTTQVETEQTTLSNPTTSDQNFATVTPSAEDETTSEKTEVTAVLIQSVSTPPTETGVEAQKMPEPERSTEPFATSQAATPAEANPSPETYDAIPAVVNTSAETSSPPTVVVSTTTTCSTPATVATETVEIPVSILPSIESPSEVTSMSSPEKTLAPMEAAQISTFPSFCSTQTTAIISPVEDQSTSVDASKETPTETPLQTDATADASEKSAKIKETKGDSDIEIQADAIKDEAESNNEENVCKSLPKRRKVETSSEPGKEKGGEPKTAPGKEAGQEDAEDQKLPKQKRSISRESSQESVRSSSPSSGSSSSTLTRHAHHKKTYENRHPAKRRRVETSEGGMEDREEDETKEEADTDTFCRRRSSSSSSPSDSDSSESRKRLTRSAKRRQQDQEKEEGNKNRKGVKVTHSSERNASNNATTSTGGESGSDTSSVRMTRKSAGSQPAQDSKAQTNSAPLLPPEPEVLGKRCSALNAAAKLLAMKGRVDTPGHTTRKDSGAKAASSSDKNQKPKSILASPQSNSVNPNGNKNKSGKPPTPDQTSRPVSRSTRQCPGQLVPPLEVEYKRPKPEEKESKKLSRGKEGEGHSACSSMSSDGEGDCGGRSSRSRSSSNSSQRTRSISSQNTEHRGSRATSSGSERDRDRSPDRAKGGSNRKERQKDRKDNRRSLKTSLEVTSSSGTEGMPDRVLRSVAALAAAQARSPAANTRSSNQQRNKT